LLDAFEEMLKSLAVFDRLSARRRITVDDLDPLRAKPIAAGIFASFCW
jgi:hypothetical protein